MRLIYHLGITRLGRAGKEYRHFGWRNECASEALQKAIDACAKKALCKKNPWKAARLYGEGAQMASRWNETGLIRHFSENEIRILNQMLEQPHAFTNELAHLEPYRIALKIGQKAAENAQAIRDETKKFSKNGCPADDRYLQDIHELLNFATAAYQKAQTLGTKDGCSTTT